MDIMSASEAKLRGEKFYYTGRRCKYGHLTVRYASSRQCVGCALEYYREYREDILEHYHNNSDVLNAKKREYRRLNSDRLNAARREQRAKRKRDLIPQEK